MANGDQERLEASVRMVLEAILSERRAQAAQAATDGSREAPQAPRRPLEARKPMTSGRAEGAPPVRHQPDHTGTELASAQAARDAAVVFMGEKLKELGGDFWPEGEWSMRVVDETGATVCAIRVTGD